MGYCDVGVLLVQLVLVLDLRKQELNGHSLRVELCFTYGEGMDYDGSD